MSGPAEFHFEGAIGRPDAAAVWRWLRHDIAPDLIDGEVEDSSEAASALGELLPTLLKRARDTVSAVAGTPAEARLLRAVGGDTTYTRLPKILLALKCRAAIEKAQSFGRAANGLHEEPALLAALQSMPMSEPAIAALLMQAALGQVAQPQRLVAAAVKLAGGAGENPVIQAGWAPLIDAILAHAQDQLPLLSPPLLPFPDIDLMCRAIDRFHRLVRGLHLNLDLGRNSRWSNILAALTRSASARIDPRLRDVPSDINLALRQPRDGSNRVDSDLLLGALNGVYLLAATRDARESLAVSAAFDQSWGAIGQSLDIHSRRALDALRAAPDSAAALQRIDAVIIMCELRFGTEYADILRRGRETALGTP